jgi:uncharacterized membrane protein YoaK (UPF0700 family)
VRPERLLLTVLAFAAGYADAAAYLGLGGVFTANMTGNMILLGLGIAQLRPGAAGRVGLSLACFAIGVALGALVLRGRRREPRPWHVERAIGLEGLLLVLLATGWTVAGPYPEGLADAPLIGLAALSMGIQSETVRAFGLWGVSTTYMTGTLTSLSAAIFARAAPPAADEAAAPRSRRATLGLTVSIWGMYLVAAVCGGRSCSSSARSASGCPPAS